MESGNTVATLRSIVARTAVYCERQLPGGPSMCRVATSVSPLAQPRLAAESRLIGSSQNPGAVPR